MTPWRPRRSCGIPAGCRKATSIEIAKTHSQQHLLAICDRKTLSEALTDVLMRLGDVNVSNALARNAGAKFSECGYATLVGRAERDESLTEKLGLRLDLPANLLREILSKAADIVLARFLTAPRPTVQRKGQAAVARGEQTARPAKDRLHEGAERGPRAQSYGQAHRLPREPVCGQGRIQQRDCRALIEDRRQDRGH